MNILEIRDLCVHVEGKTLLNNLNLTIPAGEVHALLGQNGSGKTSLMMTVMGFSKYQVTQGQILFKEQDIAPLDVTERARLGIGFAQQRPPTIQGVKLRQIIEYGSSTHEMDELVKTARLETFLERNINEGLSGGEIKRAELLQLLSTKPEFSMIDEPDSGVDAESLSVVGKLMNMLFSSDPEHPAKRKAGLVITHSADIFKYVHVDKAHIMLNGAIGCSGNPNLVMETIRKYGYEECVRCIEKGAQNGC